MARPPRFRVVSAAPSGCQLLDLHNHTRFSYDSSLKLDDYQRAHDQGLFHVLAITDHNTIDGALQFKSRASFPVIIGEEVDTRDGELIGLFLDDALPLGVSAIETAEMIHERGGLVYLQHPFYRFLRQPLDRDVMVSLGRRKLIDVVEGVNGGPMMWMADGQARAWAGRYHLPCGAGSDAHHPGDVGRCVVAVAPLNEINAAELRKALLDVSLVARRRMSLATLAARAQYAALEIVRSRVLQERRKLRIPDGGRKCDD